MFVLKFLRSIVIFSNVTTYINKFELQLFLFMYIYIFIYIDIYVYVPYTCIYIDLPTNLLCQGLVTDAKFHDFPASSCFLRLGKDREREELVEGWRFPFFCMTKIYKKLVILGDR